MTHNTYANLWLDAADQLGLAYTIINKKTAIACIYNHRRAIGMKKHNLALNSRFSTQQAKHKETTLELLDAAGIPIPPFRIFTKRKEAIAHALQKHKAQKAFVVKPHTGSNGNGITIRPITNVEITKAVRLAFASCDKILIEDFIDGHHYRITVLDDEIIAITLRISAYITGDGIHSIKELLDLKNENLVKCNMPCIDMHEKDFAILHSAGIHLGDILPKNKTLQLRSGCGYEVGDERERIAIESIPEVNKAMFIKAVSVLQLRFGGIDYISPDITIPFHKTVSGIHEINSSPHQDVHFTDRLPHDNYAAKRIIEKLFEGSPPDILVT